ncbi:MAG: hypothetical protein QOI98_2086 [Solirubrobacteraceae bacterium]|jgi:hypothetical protein|nr:hypothetical protein [Solirubrobacteraceae bacterium]
MKSRYVVVGATSALVASLAIGAPTLGQRPTGAPPGGKSPSTKSKPPAKKTGPSRKAQFAVLTGKSEVSATTGKKGAGDPNGRGSFTAVITTSKLCFGIVVAGIDAPVAAHIHRGKRGKNGPILVTLGTPDAGDPGSSSGCVEGLTQSLTNELRNHPSRFYVNVHTTAFGGGALRGQMYSSNGSG